MESAHDVTLPALGIAAEPLCDGVVSDLLAGWGGLFMSMIFLFFTMIFTCHGSKILFQIREGKYTEPELYAQMDAGTKQVAPGPSAAIHDKDADPLAAATSVQLDTSNATAPHPTAGQ